MKSMLEYALEYRISGFSVIPLCSNKQPCWRKKCGDEGGHGKRPLIEWAVYQEQLPTEEEIKMWWRNWKNANIGIITGRVSGIVVLDIDPRNGGDQSIDKKHLPVTVTQKTGGDGVHYFFKYQPNIESHKGFLSGVDFQADKAYIVVAPSIHKSGKTYEFCDGLGLEEIEIAPVPEWVLEQNNKKTIKQNSISNQTTDEMIQNGKRNVTLASIAGTFRKRGLSEVEILPSLLTINKTRCSPPLSASEVMDIAKSIGSYHTQENIITAIDNECLTDLGNAKRLINKHGSILRYITNWGKWIVWNNNMWKVDLCSEVYRLVEDILNDLLVSSKISEKDNLKNHAFKSQGKSRIEAMIDLAKTQPNISISPQQLDKDPYLLNCLNSTINLKTGELLPHSKEHLITKTINVNYDSHAKCPNFEKFLLEIMGEDKEKVNYLQRVFGYSLTGDIREQILFFFYGTGANGKSTLLNTIKTLLSDYAKQAAPNLLVQKQNESHPTELADLCGARFVTCVEVEEGKRLAENLVKQMTGGDTIKARFMRQDFFEFTPTHKIFLAANHKPKIIGTDYAIWRRIHLVPFHVTIPEGKQDKMLQEKLTEEIPGILSWAVKGCLDWQRMGLHPPKEVIAAKEEYREEMDIIALFINDCCIMDSKATVSCTNIYKKYVDWCNESGEFVLSKINFGKKLEEKGFSVDRKSQGLRVRKGLCLKEMPNPYDVFCD